MARPNKTRKTGKWQKSYKHHTKTKKKLDADTLKKRKNVKSIQRAKEMEEMHRKQKNVEDKYRLQNLKTNMSMELGLDADLSDDDMETEQAQEENPFDDLVSELTKQSAGEGEKSKRNQVESSDDSDDDDDSEEEDELEEEEGEGEDDMSGEEENILEVEDEEAGGDIENVEEQNDNLAAVEDDEVEEYSDSEDDTNAKTIDASKGDASLLDMLEAKEKLLKADSFSLHLDYEVPPDEVEKLLATPINYTKYTPHWPAFGQLTVEVPTINRPAEQLKQIELLYKDPEESSDNNQKKMVQNRKNKLKSLTPIKTSQQLQTLGVKTSLASHVPLPLTQLQTEIFSVLQQYQDLYYPEQTLTNATELRTVYCLHALNHMLKTRSRILHHNAKLAAAAQLAKNKSSSKKNKKQQQTTPSLDTLVPDGYRDQGLVRPKVLIVLPFRETAYQVVNCMAQLMHGNDCIVDGKAQNNSVMHYERFVSEYTGQTLHLSKTNPKPEDYEQIFTGNTDDNFRMGITLTKKCLKLYTDFYASDILLASPLGLRLIVGAPGSKERDYDFLNSIELLIVDQAQLLYAQNWENVLHLLEHLHLQPQSLRDTDFQRVRPWCLSGLGRFYRQTLLFASHELAEFRALSSNSSKCCNYAGRVRISNPVQHGDIRKVAVPVPQLFQRVVAHNLESVFDQRFKYFIQEVLPRFRAPSHAHCMIYVPSYFDYIRLRNYFKAETISFVQICEYTNRAKMARARDLFFHSGAHFMLYSERAHFYRRTRVKGIRHLIMYQPPMWPHFYSEIVNLMHSANQNSRDGLEDSMSITVLYTKYDLLQLKAILGSDAAIKLVQAGQKVHTFTAE